MKGINFAMTMIIVLIIGVIVLMLVTGIISASSTTTTHIATQNDLYNCCRKFLPLCSNEGTVCYVDETGEVTIEKLAGELYVDNLQSFCGCLT